MRYTIVEWLNSSPKAKHLLDVSRTGRLGYAEAKSIEAFRRRANYTFMENLKARAFHVYLSPELDGGMGAFEAEAYGFDQLPVIEHESVFNFYDSIGYDYKAKRYR